MIKYSTAKARKELAELINRSAYGKDRFALMRRGKPLAALVPFEDAQLLEELEDRIDFEVARQALREKTFSWESVKKERKRKAKFPKLV